jgi:hypothetical protein
MWKRAKGKKKSNYVKTSRWRLVEEAAKKKKIKELNWFKLERWACLKPVSATQIMFQHYTEAFGDLQALSVRIPLLAQADGYFNVCWKMIY